MDESGIPEVLSRVISLARYSISSSLPGEVKDNLAVSVSGRLNIFLKPLCVMLDQVFCGGNDFWTGAVIDIHVDFMSVGKVLFKVQHDVRVGAPKRIDGLVIIANYTQISLFSRKQVKDFFLNMVCVLVFIANDVFICLLAFFQKPGVFL